MDHIQMALVVDVAEGQARLFYSLHSAGLACVLYEALELLPGRRTGCRVVDGATLESE
jgi:hypothetical protein